MPKYPSTCDVEWVDAEDPLFLLYTSGSTGKPKVQGVINLLILRNYCSFLSLTFLYETVTLRDASYTWVKIADRIYIMRI